MPEPRPADVLSATRKRKAPAETAPDDAQPAEERKETKAPRVIKNVRMVDRSEFAVIVADQFSACMVNRNTGAKTVVVHPYALTAEKNQDAKSVEEA